jgi:hypothetical protein
LKCIACGSDNPDRAKFCVECGGAFVARCLACNVELPVGAKFCLECGVRVGASSPAHAILTRETPKHLADKIRLSKAAVEGERKQVTVLFADVKGSMELAEQLDPEAWSAIMQRFFTILADGVERFEGFVVGDGVRVRRSPRVPVLRRFPPRLLERGFGHGLLPSTYRAHTSSPRARASKAPTGFHALARPPRIVCANAPARGVLSWV